MSRLLCLVGIHRPVLPGEWNLGYGFSTCEHCGRDMVRSVLDGWKAPRHFKVIRGGPQTMYEDLDAFLRARERPRPVARTIDMSAPPLPRSASPASDVRRAPKSPGGSPFDFSDFEPGTIQPPPPLKNVKTG